MNKKMTVYAAYVVAVLLAVLAVVYWVTPADQLPHLLPGYEAGVTKTHFKHGLAAGLLALACVAFGWFQGGPQAPVADGSVPKEQ